MDLVLNDLRHALRALVKNWLVTLPAVLSLALGIGANTTIVTFLYAVFVQPLEVERPTELVSIFSNRLDEPGLRPVSYLNYRDFRDKNRVFQDLAASSWIGVDLDLGDGPLRLFGEMVSANYFEVLGLRPAAGRLFGSAQEGKGEPEIVLSNGFWQRHYGGQPDVIGKGVLINGFSFTVIGVAPATFQGLNVLQAPELWMPMDFHEQLLLGGAAKLFNNRSGNLLDVVGRLQPDVDLEQAQAAFEVLARNLMRSFPEENRGLGVVLEPLVRHVIPAGLRGGFVLTGWLLMGVVGLLLLIACVNVANLLLARALARRRETAVRLAMGAGWGPLLRQLMTEGMLLALAGGIAGLAVAVVGRELLWRLRPFYLPDTLDISFSPLTLAFTLGLSLLIGVVFSLAPLSQARNLDLSSELKERAASYGGGFGARNALVVVQIALSMVVLMGAGLFYNSLRKLEDVDPGFETKNLFLIPVAIGSQGYNETDGRLFYASMVERVTAIGNVESATVTRRPVLAPGGPRTGIESDDLDVHERAAGVLFPWTTVGGPFFETLGLDLLEGRTFSSFDRAGAPEVVVINKAMAELLWPGRSPIGEHIRFEVDETEIEVVGVVENAKHSRLSQEDEPYLYVSVEQTYSPSMILHVRTKGKPETVAPLVRQEIHALEPKLPLLETRFVQDLVKSSLWAARMIAGLLGFFAFLALVLAAIGIYGVMAYNVRLRQREIGIRMAMGADRRGILVLVLRQGMTLAAIGIVVGLVVGVAATWGVAELLYQVTPYDPATLVTTAVVLTLVAFVALLLPARRATTVHPISVLREE